MNKFIFCIGITLKIIQAPFLFIRRVYRIIYTKLFSPFFGKRLFQPQYHIRDALITKIIRYALVVFMFYGSAQLMGMQPREAQQFIYMLGAIALFGLLLKNIWITLFLGWTVFLFSFYKFSTGHPYVMNVFLGCIIYYLVKVSFKQEHIRFYINAFLWFAIINIAYGIIQKSGYDWIHWLNTGMAGKYVLNTNHLSGFMGNDGIFGMLMAFTIPIFCVYNIWLAPLLFIPIIASTGSINYLAGGMAYMFVLYHRINRKVWVTLAVSCFLLAIPYILLNIGDLNKTTDVGWYKTINKTVYGRIDKPDYSRFDVWKFALIDTQMHPLVGMGLDSFRRDDMPHKKMRYAMRTTTDEQVNKYKRLDLAIWDNPHNLYISILFEWGLVGILIMLGYIVHLGTLFKKSLKSPETVALAGFLVAVLVVSIGHFPLFLSRMAVFIVPLAALFERSCE